jgi:hypothetical protein
MTDTIKFGGSKFNRMVKLQYPTMHEKAVHIRPGAINFASDRVVKRSKRACPKRTAWIDELLLKYKAS